MLRISFTGSSNCFGTVPELTLPTAPSPTTTPTNKYQHVHFPMMLYTHLMACIVKIFLGLGRKEVVSRY